MTRRCLGQAVAAPEPRDPTAAHRHHRESPGSSRHLCWACPTVERQSDTADYRPGRCKCKRVERCQEDGCTGGGEPAVYTGSPVTASMWLNTCCGGCPGPVRTYVPVPGGPPVGGASGVFLPLTTATPPTPTETASSTANDGYITSVSQLGAVSTPCSVSEGCPTTPG